MANLLSDLMTNVLASPSVMNNPHLSHARVRSKIATLTVAAADDINDIWYIARFKASDRILQVLHAHDAVAGLTDADIGLYGALKLQGDTAAVKDIDIYGDGINMGAADLDVWTDAAVDGAAGIRVGEVLGQPVWADAGDSAEPTPGTEYDMCLTAKTEPTGAGTVKILVYYVAGD